MTSRLKVLLLIFFILLAVAGGLFAKKALTPQIEVPEGWKTYQDVKNGLVISYPSDAAGEMDNTLRLSSAGGEKERRMSVVVRTSDDPSLDASGCWVTASDIQKKHAEFNGVSLCLTVVDVDQFDGRSSRTYTYTTRARGTYVSIVFQVEFATSPMDSETEFAEGRDTELFREIIRTVLVK